MPWLGGWHRALKSCCLPYWLCSLCLCLSLSHSLTHSLVVAAITTLFRKMVASPDGACESHICTSPWQHSGSEVPKKVSVIVDTTYSVYDCSGRAGIRWNIPPDVAPGLQVSFFTSPWTEASRQGASWARLSIQLQSGVAGQQKTRPTLKRTWGLWNFVAMSV